MEKQYMNIETGSVDDHDGWDYETETGELANAVELGEVVEVEPITTVDGDGRTIISGWRVKE